jgi:hypothetical protein
MPSKYGVLTRHPDKKYGGSSTSNYVKLMKDIMNVLAPKYDGRGWQLSYRHIKGGIFRLRLE